ncbi:hypothetical protein Q8A67_012055 [Cirrhinus molitorella]|uniref:Uncharacterized protein n=1 Tax=Cirrhinus molitorella TaxID=172907 RepID=A0AA88PXC4_9TELE|nr:hypothetical protein Q8A67_012055 [Cirrhinus molitorella]
MGRYHTEVCTFFVFLRMSLWKRCKERNLMERDPAHGDIWTTAERTKTSKPPCGINRRYDWTLDCIQILNTWEMESTGDAGFKGTEKSQSEKRQSRGAVL